MSQHRPVMILSLLLALFGLAACSVAVDTPAEVPAAEESANTLAESAPEAAVEESADAPAEPTAEPAPASNPVTFSLVPDETEARFRVNEVLTGQPTEVVGTTSAVTGGDITVDFANPAGATVSPVTVDLSTLVTDNNFRNRAIQDAILQSSRSEFQYAEFTVTSVSGLPDRVTVGQPVTFQISGDMSLHGVTAPLTFDATATPVSETRLEGTASTTIPYADFGIAILRLPPQVASVEDMVTLEIQFAAEAQG